MNNFPFSRRNSSDLEQVFIVDEVRVHPKSVGSMSIVVVAQDLSRCGSPSKTVYGQPAGPSKIFIQTCGDLDWDLGIKMDLRQMKERFVELRNQRLFCRSFHEDMVGSLDYSLVSCSLYLFFSVWVYVSVYIYIYVIYIYVFINT